MHVVFDTNIWIKELGLNSKLGSATRLFLQKHSATIAIPEVIRTETETHLRDELRDYISKIKNNHSKLLTVFGKLKEISLPNDEEIGKVVDNIFKDLEVPIKHLPFTLESSKDSFHKIINKLPPSDRNQQFKDGVIWSDCKRLLEKDDVYFVTNDKAFFKGHDYGKGLAKSLLEEAKEKPNNFEIHSELTSLLEDIRTQININPDELLEKFLEEYQDNVQSILDRFSYNLDEISSDTITAYATQSPSTIYVEFELQIDCFPIEDDGRSNGVLKIKGDATFDPSEEQFVEIKRLGEEFKYRLADGTEETSKNVVARVGPLVIGHRETQHDIRYKL